MSREVVICICNCVDLTPPSVLQLRDGTIESSNKIGLHLYVLVFIENIKYAESTDSKLHCTLSASVVPLLSTKQNLYQAGICETK
jgi:hypothetical protein